MLKRNEPSSLEKTWKKQIHITKWKQQIWRLQTIWFQGMTFWKEQNHADSKKVSGRQKLGRWEGWRGRTQRCRIFIAAKRSCMVLQWWMYLTMHLTKHSDCTTQRVNPNVNYRHWVTMMCHCTIINCNKCATFVNEADNRRG